MECSDPPGEISWSVAPPRGDKLECSDPPGENEEEQGGGGRGGYPRLPLHPPPLSLNLTPHGKLHHKAKAYEVTEKRSTVGDAKAASKKELP